jgi:ATP-binding protein involved in chromosome partitioning
VRDTVLEVLKTIPDPAGGDLVSSGVMRALNVEGGAVRFVMEIAPQQAKAYEQVKPQAETA